MKVLITGAAGFLGRHFMDKHLELGDDVVAIDNYQSPYAAYREEVQPVDCREYFSTESAHQFDRVYHFAALVGGREKIEGDPFYNADSLDLDSRLFRWLAADPPEQVVYPSSSAVYPVGLQQGRAYPLSESDCDVENGEWSQPDEMYGFTKFVGEYLAWRASRFGVNTLCIRPFSGYGEDQGMDYPMPSIAERVRQNQDPLLLWGSGHQVRDWIHVDDVVGATLARCHAMFSGYNTMNIGSGVGVSFLDLAQSMTMIAGTRPEIATLISKPAGVEYRVANPSRMNIYYEPKVSLEKGLRRMLDA